jgi:hypothetical protein
VIISLERYSKWIPKFIFWVPVHLGVIPAKKRFCLA